MPSLKDHLARIRAFAESSAFSPFSRAENPEALLEPLRLAADRLLERSGRSTILRPDILMAARKKWTQYSDFSALSNREVRVLCNDPETATNPKFIAALKAQGDLSMQRARLEGLIGQYFSAWGSIRQAEEMESLLRAAVADFTGHSRRASQCKPFAVHLFSTSAAHWIGKQFLDTKGSASERLSVWGVDPESGLGRAGINNAVKVWAAYVEQSGAHLSLSEAEARIEDLLGVLLESPYVGAVEAGKAISVLVLSPVLQGEFLLNKVREYIMRSSRFGDPRLPANAGRWGICTREARDRVASWFSKRDLEFFFDHAIPRREDPHGRRPFWKQYLHHVKDCVVLLSEEDEWRLRAHNTDRLEYGRTRGLPGVSAFVLQFQNADGLLIVEFSRSGNALHIHDSEKFFSRFGQLRSRTSFNISDLKSPLTRKYRPESHTSLWTENIANFLRTKGIRPQ